MLSLLVQVSSLLPLLVQFGTSPSQVIHQEKDLCVQESSGFSDIILDLSLSEAS